MKCKMLRNPLYYGTEYLLSQYYKLLEEEGYFMQALYKRVIGERINRKAECLYNLIGKKPGFDIIQAVERLGGEVCSDYDSQLAVGIDAKISAEVDGDDIKFKIIYAPNLSEDYKRFCIAHELGHLFLHMTEKNQNGEIVISKGSFYKNNDFSKMYEWEAEEFAACFLMPEEEFRNSIESLDGDVERLARKFKVSPQSVIMRCKRLGFIS